ncbi:chloroplast envelope quinone oxidoreductase homolog [Selaginella moellendorffii]|nr:chloroplast envelope quinone oxidoreductase homolog [Selaginella moellendorffii]|eukprot:XP_002975582.2 chloroplast envelope quinone oxidoreductase homolog [Selaginella moellendorffii]
MAEGASKKMMAALQYSKYGEGATGLKHVEIPVPTPKKDEILVKIEAAAINPVDWKLQKGMLKVIYSIKFPYIPCTDVSGEVVSVGPGVTGFSQGDKVISWLDLKRGGGFAQYAVAGIKYTAKRPSGVSAVEAAALPVAGLTAYQSLRDSGGLKYDGSYKGNVLITAASGGVGTYAVQLAKLAGAHVTATCGARNVDLVRSLGADEVLDYKTPEGAALKSPSGKKYDVVLQCATTMPWSTFQPVLSSKGKVIDLTPSFGVMLTSAFKFLTMSKQKMTIFVMSANAKDLGELAELVNEKKVKSLIDSEFPLDKAEDAWAKSIESHATGKIVVTNKDEAASY